MRAGARILHHPPRPYPDRTCACQGRPPRRDLSLSSGLLHSVRNDVVEGADRFALFEGCSEIRACFFPNRTAPLRRGLLGMTRPSCHSEALKRSGGAEESLPRRPHRACAGPGMMTVSKIPRGPQKDGLWGSLCLPGFRMALASGIPHLRFGMTPAGWMTFTCHVIPKP